MNLQNVHYGLIGIFTVSSSDILNWTNKCSRIKLHCLPSPTPPPRNNFVYLADGLQVFAGCFLTTYASVLSWSPHGVVWPEIGYQGNLAQCLILKFSPLKVFWQSSMHSHLRVPALIELLVHNTLSFTSEAINWRYWKSSCTCKSAGTMLPAHSEMCRNNFRKNFKKCR